MDKRKALMTTVGISAAVSEIASVSALASIGGSIAKDELYIINTCKSILEMHEQHQTTDHHEDGDQKE